MNRFLVGDKMDVGEKVSVIVPVYNVEEYLDYCIKSILSQDYQNIEVLLIDDGSTDSSGAMCDSYAMEDERIRVIHKENGGLSSARNTGLLEMTGDFFSFVDSDDYVRTDYISRMLSYLNKDNSDMVICSFEKVIGEKDCSQFLKTESDYEVYDRETIQFKMLSRQVPMYAHGKMFRNNLKKWIRFPEGRLFEDVPTVWNVVKHVNKVSYISDRLYFYRQRLGSIVNTKYRHERLDQVVFSEQIYDEVYSNLTMRYIAASRCFFAASDSFTFVTKDFPNDIAYIKNVIKKYRREVLQDMYAGRNLKVMALISYLNVDVIRIIGRLYKRKNYCQWKKYGDN